MSYRGASWRQAPARRCLGLCLAPPPLSSSLGHCIPLYSEGCRVKRVQGLLGGGGLGEETRNLLFNFVDLFY